ncbi:hypothetical protein OR1_03289 [Geobacter sp. OR-1]|uniref:YgiQ family radical SAM protein n=1 Tax=Geobacter sp. OR-1 TaxID=1266765 RepID=UPI000543E8EB|nr:YgiQ family radical SAM protein [Geobacter sp. OR-1]GAM10981.1 hypothetical protein OR1_03289 [Geobacter sp. OR-1]
MFLPVTRAEVLIRGWHELDIVFVTGDAYIDHPAFGVPLLARWLESHGFRVGILAQPDWKDPEAFKALGKPRLFFAVAAGAMDSMVAHYTPEKRLRRDDAYTPGNRHGARPNRATIVYTSCCKAAYKDVPVVIGGIEASLRRFAHYDFWDDKVRRSILFDSKADLLIYGMGERSLLELAQRVQKGEPIGCITDIRGTAFAAAELPADAEQLAACEVVQADRQAYAQAYRVMSESQNPFSLRRLGQRHGSRFLVCNPPPMPLTTAELDTVYSLPFTRVPHSGYTEPIPAWEQIKSSVTTHRGCYGGCSFCAITLHQGRVIQSRSIASITAEVKAMGDAPWFKGIVSDLGGPTANMYGSSCSAPDAGASCRRLSCLHPKVCPQLKVADKIAAEMLRVVKRLPLVRHVTVTSGIRYDLLLCQPEYFRELVAHHVGGLLKVAPEHCCDKVLRLMRKPAPELFEDFLARFRSECARLGKRYGVVPYLMSGHPGTTLSDMVDLGLFLRSNRLKVEQVQQFTPTPGTLATAMYYTGIDPFSGAPVYVARKDREKQLQKSLLLAHLPAELKKVKAALSACNREDAARALIPAQMRESVPVKGSGVFNSTVAPDKKKNKIKKIRK